MAVNKRAENIVGKGVMLVISFFPSELLKNSGLCAKCFMVIHCLLYFKWPSYIIHLLKTLSHKYDKPLIISAMRGGNFNVYLHKRNTYNLLIHTSTTRIQIFRANPTVFTI